jgi:hypothetical protein
VNKSKKNENGEARSTKDREVKCMQDLVRKLEERDQLEDPGVDGKYHCNEKKLSENNWIDLA